MLRKQKEKPEKRSIKKKEITKILASAYCVFRMNYITGLFCTVLNFYFFYSQHIFYFAKSKFVYKGLVIPLPNLLILTFLRLLRLEIKIRYNYYFTSIRVGQPFP